MVSLNSGKLSDRKRDHFTHILSLNSHACILVVDAKANISNN